MASINATVHLPPSPHLRVERFIVFDKLFWQTHRSEECPNELWQKQIKTFEAVDEKERDLTKAQSRRSSRQGRSLRHVGRSPPLAPTSQTFWQRQLLPVCKPLKPGWRREYAACMADSSPRTRCLIGMAPSPFGINGERTSSKEHILSPVEALSKMPAMTSQNGRWERLQFSCLPSVAAPSGNRIAL